MENNDIVDKINEIRNKRIVVVKAKDKYDDSKDSYYDQEHSKAVKRMLILYEMLKPDFVSEYNLFSEEFEKEYQIDKKKVQLKEKWDVVKKEFNLENISNKKLEAESYRNWFEEMQNKYNLLIVENSNKLCACDVNKRLVNLINNEVISLDKLFYISLNASRECYVFESEKHRQLRSKNYANLQLLENADGIIERVYNLLSKKEKIQKSE